MTRSIGDLRILAVVQQKTSKQYVRVFLRFKDNQCITVVRNKTIPLHVSSRKIFIFIFTKWNCLKNWRLLSPYSEEISLIWLGNNIVKIVAFCWETEASTMRQVIPFLTTKLQDMNVYVIWFQQDGATCLCV